MRCVNDDDGGQTFSSEIYSLASSFSLFVYMMLVFAMIMHRNLAYLLEL